MNEQKTILHFDNTIPAASVTAVRIGSATLGARSRLSFEEIDGLLSLEDRYPEMKALKDIQSKREFVMGKRDEMRRELDGIEGELKTKCGKQDYLRAGLTIFKEIDEWVETELQIERPDGVSFRALRRAVADGRTVYLDRDPGAETPAREFEKEVSRFAEIVLIEHDWAGAMQGADVADAVVKLPYDVCAFEFKFSGRAVIALATQFETDIAFSPAIECGDHWLLTGFVTPASGYSDDKNAWLNLFNVLGSQIRAACIALDAEVAKSEAMREPYIGSHGKNVYHEPKPYHIISLAKPSARPLAAPGQETGRRVRLHFRRGHWRHFESHKTWIKWMLVGDPDLGFVEKHYRL